MENRTGRALSYSMLIALQNLIGLAYQLYLVWVIGASSQMDAYVTSMLIPVFLQTLAQAALTYSLVPITVPCRTGTRALHPKIASIGIATMAAMLLISAGVWLSAELITGWLVPGFSPAKKLLTADLVRWQTIIALLTTAFTFLSSIHMAENRFRLVGWTQLSAGIISLVCVISFVSTQGIYAMVSSLMYASLFQFFVLFFWFDLASWKPTRNDQTKKDLKAYAILTIPLLLAALFGKLDQVADRIICSYLPEGTITCMGYSLRLVSLLYMLTAGGVGNASLTRLSELASEQNLRECGIFLGKITQFFMVCMPPIIISLAVFSEPVLLIIFSKSRFSPHDIKLLSICILGYLGVYVSGVFATFLNNASYAVKDTWTPTIVGGILGTLAVIALKFALLPPLGAFGVALASSAVGTVLLFVYAGLLRKKGINLPPGQLRHCAQCLALPILAATATALYAKAYWHGITGTVCGLAMTAVIYTLTAWIAAPQQSRQAFKIMRGQSIS